MKFDPTCEAKWKDFLSGVTVSLEEHDWTGYTCTSVWNSRIVALV